jgi:hypothetical protein
MSFMNVTNLIRIKKSTRCLLLFGAFAFSGLVGCAAQNNTIRPNVFSDQQSSLGTTSGGCCTYGSEVAIPSTAKIGRRLFPVRWRDTGSTVNKRKFKGAKRASNDQEVMMMLMRNDAPNYRELASDISQKQDHAHPIGYGDLLHISVYADGEKREDFTADVSTMGKMTSPMIGEMYVAGLTASTVAARMKELLGRGLYLNPRVLVRVKE